MCTHNLCFEQNKKNIKKNHPKINIFTAVKYCCILHGRVCVMQSRACVVRAHSVNMIMRTQCVRVVEEIDSKKLILPFKGYKIYCFRVPVLGKILPFKGYKTYRFRVLILCKIYTKHMFR